jgi:trans-aconitate 2-methyltransferase
MDRSISTAATVRRTVSISSRSKLRPILNAHLSYQQQHNPSRSYRATAKTKDWSAAQYLKFEEQRTRPARDLLSRTPISNPQHIVDLGCGPGNSTAVVLDRYPKARVTGMDSSEDMIKTAKAMLPHVDFTLADLSSYTPAEPVDLLFSNAVFQWIAHEDRIPIMERLINSLPSGGVFAFQVPDNYLEPTHKAMREVAQKGPWAETLAPLKPGLGPFHSPQELYNSLKPLCSSLDIWHTYYHHPLPEHKDVVEWVKGTGLRPFVDPLAADQKEGFLEAYMEKIKQVYPSSVDGSVLLRYPRLFLVAVRA